MEKNVVIVELKQREKLTAIDGQDAIVETYTGGANRRVVHPCYQAWSYAALIRDYQELCEKCDALRKTRKICDEQMEDCKSVAIGRM